MKGQPYRQRSCPTRSSAATRLAQPRRAGCTIGLIRDEMQGLPSLPTTGGLDCVTPKDEWRLGFVMQAGAACWCVRVKPAVFDDCGRPPFHIRLLRLCPCRGQGRRKKLKSLALGGSWVRLSQAQQPRMGSWPGLRATPTADKAAFLAIKGAE